MSSSSSQAMTCSICLKRLRHCKLGKPEPCHHIFCFVCISEWAKNVNTCPVDRIKFNAIEVFVSLNGECVEKVYVPDQTIDNEVPDLTHCEVCHDHHREHQLLLCDGCDKGYHLDCLTPPLSEVPEGDWYCPFCEPIVNAQYQYSDNESLVWETSSGSDVDTRRPKSKSKVVITDSEESTSGSDVDEMRVRRTALNICSVGSFRVLVSSSEEESEVEVFDDSERVIMTERDENSKARVKFSTSNSFPQWCSSSARFSAADEQVNLSYVGLLRKFSKSTADGQLTSKKSSNAPVIMEADSPSKPQALIKSCSVLVTPMNIKPKNQPTHPQPSTSFSNSQSSITWGSSNSDIPIPGPSSSRVESGRIASGTRKRRRRKRGAKLTLGKAKRASCRKKKNTPQTCSNDSEYRVQSHIIPNHRDPVRTRSKARTVATHTPQQLTFRAAVKESYRYKDFNAGLENARKIILQSKVSFKHTPQRWISRLRTPQSGYVNNARRERMISEVRRRTIPEGRKLVLQERKPQPYVADTPNSRHSLSHTGIDHTEASSGLVEQIWQSLNDLNARKNIIQRDGTILPLRDESPEYMPPKQPVGSKKNPIVIESPTDCVCDLSKPEIVINDSISSSPVDLTADLTNGSCRHYEQKFTPKTLEFTNHHQPKTQKFTYLRLDPLLPFTEEPSSSTDSKDGVQSPPDIRHYIKTELDRHRRAGAVTGHQYERILDRATSKVMRGKSTTVERVRKLVSDYVSLYKLSQ